MIVSRTSSRCQDEHASLVSFAKLHSEFEFSLSIDPLQWRSKTSLVLWPPPSWCTRKCIRLTFSCSLVLRGSLTCNQWNYSMLNSSKRILSWDTAYFDFKSLKDRETERSTLQHLLVQTAVSEYGGGTPRWWQGCVRVGRSRYPEISYFMT